MQTIHAAAGPRGLGVLVAPYARLGRRGMLAVAAAQAVAGLALARAGVRFDGALDVHRTWTGALVPPAYAALDQVAAWPVAVAAALLVLRLWRCRPGATELLLVWGMARAALVLTSLTVFALPTPAEFVGGASAALVAPAPGVAAAAVVGALGFGWFVALLVAGLRAVTGASGGRLAAVTAAVLVAAEAASKLVLAAA